MSTDIILSRNPRAYSCECGYPNGFIEKQKGSHYPYCIKRAHVGPMPGGKYWSLKDRPCAEGDLPPAEVSLSHLLEKGVNVYVKPYVSFNDPKAWKLIRSIKQAHRLIGRHAQHSARGYVDGRVEFYVIKASNS